ncbi:acyltransferase [Serratia marcescens]|nr:acyltransferase [Serratia marcescens]
MMDKYIVALKVAYSGCRVLLSKLIFRRQFSTKKVFFTTDLPHIRCRVNGRIYIGNVKFRNGCRIFADGGKISISDGCFINNDCSFNAKGRIEIGENTLFGEGVKIYDHNHRIGNSYVVSKIEFDVSDVIIGRNCWIGSNVTILKGVKLADNVIIGAGSVVTKSIFEPGVYISSNGGLKKIK